MCIKMTHRITTCKNVFQYQTAKVNSAKPQLLLHPRLCGPGCGPSRQDGDLEGHLLTICPAGNTCSPVSLWEEEGTAVRGHSMCQRGGVSTWLPGSPHITSGTGRMKGFPPLPTGSSPVSGDTQVPAHSPHPSYALTVAVWEVSEAFSTRVASRPREVWSAVAAAGQVLTRPVCEVRLTAAA